MLFPFASKSNTRYFNLARRHNSQRLHVVWISCFVCGWLLGCQGNSKPANSKQSGSKAASQATPQAKEGSSRPLEIDKKTRSKPSVDRAQRLFESGQRDLAWEETQRVLITESENPLALFIAAQILAHKGRVKEAVDLVDQIGLDVPGVSSKATALAIDWLTKEGALIEAERRLRDMASRWPEDRSVDRKLANLYQLQGRRWEAAQHLHQLVAAGTATEFDLMSLIDLTQPLDARKEVAELLAKPRHDPSAELGLGFWELHENRMTEARQHFDRVVQAPGAPAMAWVGIGLVLSSERDSEGLQSWYAGKPDGVEALPEYWIVIGRWSRDVGNAPSATRCFWEVLQRDSGHIEALYQLSLLLEADGQTELAKKYRDRLALKLSAHQTLQRLSAGVREPAMVSQFTEQLSALGFHAESASWGLYAARLEAASEDRLQEWEKERRKWVALRSNGLPSVFDIDRQRFPLPTWLEDLPKTAAASSTRLVDSNRLLQKAEWIRFDEVSEQIGVHYRIETGDDPSVPGAQIHQSNGCGIGIIDFDRDGWPDLYCNQSGGNPAVPRTSGPASLYWNRVEKPMNEVANIAQVTNGYYGQGVAVGDVDQDGFPDLYVLNIGPNRIYLNQGDGTFREVACPQGKGSSEWSTSGAIADLNGDAIPDLIEINYAGGPEVLTKKCPGADGFPRVCLPTQFPALDDYVFFSQVDGSFVGAPASWNLQVSGGRGLGVIIANFDDKFGNDAFIANDMSANHFLVSSLDATVTDGEKRWMLRDEAGSRGNAVDAQGQSQACMGIALGDIDRNGWLDMLVTNIYDEYNTLYMQSSAGRFEDSTRKYQLVEPAMNMVGFGTQFADVDLDGWLDALVLNGHVDDYSEQGKAYEMLPQLFVGDGKRFIWLKDERLGSYFASPKVGRTLALWDFDRDGLLDFVGNHIESPLAILHNRTKLLNRNGQSPSAGPAGHWIGLELVGTMAERDAIGAKVVIRAGEQQWIGVSSAGDGFQSSNQRMVHFGLGEIDRLDAVTVHWPGGHVESLGTLVTDRYHLVVESRQ